MTAIGGGLERRQRDLLGIVGHELRNPLAAVLTGVSVAAEMTDPDDPRAQFLDLALADLHRLTALLDGCLLLGSVRRPAPGDAVDLAALANDVARRYAEGFVTVRGGGRPIIVVGEAALLERVLENLVDNASAVGARAVSILISDDGDDRAAVHVGDDGPGVPAELAGRLFEPFVSGRGSSGLGLAIVAQIVDAHGGDVRLLPSVRGALFRIELPKR